MRELFAQGKMLMHAEQMGAPKAFAVRGFSAGQGRPASSMTVLPAWTPAEISTALWMDAADTSTATVVDGKISQRTDKSGNDRHATQATAGLRPVAGANKDVYDGADDRMTVPDSNVLDSPKYMLVVCKPTPSKDYAAVLEKWNSSAGWQIVYGSGAARTLPNLAVNSSSINSPAHVNNTIAVFEGQIDGSNSFFGTTAAGFATGTLPAPTATTSVLWVGGDASSSNVLAMDFHEAIILSSIPDTPTRQRLEGYVSHKWDALLGVTTLVDALPSDHPYKSFAPEL